MYAVILAAGESKRFGGNKLLHEVSGKPMILNVLEALPQSHFEAIGIVVNPNSQRLKQVLAKQDLTFLENESASEGMSTSVQLAGDWAAANDQDLFLTLGDIPFVTPKENIQLIKYFQSETIFSESQGAVGPPVIFAKKDLSQLSALSGDVGAKKLFPFAKTVSLPNANRDIDRPGQLNEVE